MSKGAAHGTKEFPVQPVAFILWNLGKLLCKKIWLLGFFIFLIFLHEILSSCCRDHPPANWMLQRTVLVAPILNLVPTLPRPSTCESLLNSAPPLCRSGCDHIYSILLNMAWPKEKNQASDLWNPETKKMVTATHREERSWGSIFSIRFIFLYFATISHLQCFWGPSAPKNQKMEKNQLPFFAALQALCQKKLTGEAQETGWGWSCERCWEIRGFTMECGTAAKLHGTGSGKQL